MCSSVKETVKSVSNCSDAVLRAVRGAQVMWELGGRASKSLQVGKPRGEIPLEPSPQGEVTVI